MKTTYHRDTQLLLQQSSTNSQAFEQKFRAAEEEVKSTMLIADERYLDLQREHAQQLAAYKAAWSADADEKQRLVLQLQGEFQEQPSQLAKRLFKKCLSLSFNPFLPGV